MGWVILGILAFNVVFFGALVLKYKLERRNKK